MNCRALMSLLAEQNELYRPGPFWQEASNAMLADFERLGLACFRQQSLPLTYFVPTYGYPGNALSASTMQVLTELTELPTQSAKQQAYLQQFSSGYAHALADYRVLAAAEWAQATYPDLMQFSESTAGSPQEQFTIEGQRYSRSALNYLLGLTFLKRYVDFQQLQTVLEIGGGFGTLGEIIYQTMPSARYIDVDIPPTLCCAHYYLQQLAGDVLTPTIDAQAVSPIHIAQLKRITTLPSWSIERLQGKIDLFVNFISFQEMEPPIVQNYLNHVSRLEADWVLLRNMREGKQKRTAQSVGVEQPIYAEDYVAMLPNYQLIATNVLPFGFKTVDGFHSELMLFQRIV